MTMQPCRVCGKPTETFHELYHHGHVDHMYLCGKHMSRLNMCIRSEIESMINEEAEIDAA